MEETLVQGHTEPGMEPGVIPGVTDTKAQLFRLLSPLLCPAQVHHSPVCREDA